MKRFKKLLHVKDTCSYGNYTAIAQYFAGVRIEVDIYLYKTLICVIGLYNHTFELANYDWTTSTTIRAIKKWLEYLQDEGYRLVDMQWTGKSPNTFNLSVRIPANAHIGGYYIMNNNSKLQCNHVGISDGQLKSMATDNLFISSPIDFNLGIQPHGCYMRGRNEKEIVQNVAIYNGVKFTLHFQMEEAPEMYGLWIYKDNLYLFKFRTQKVAYRDDFQALNATYTAIEMYKSRDSSVLDLVRMLGCEGTAHMVYQEMLNNFERLA